VRASQQNDEDDGHCDNNISSRSASVTVTSSASSASRSNEDDRDIHYVVINSAQSTVASSSSSLAVNWQASNAPINALPSQGQGWLNQLLFANGSNLSEDKSSLAVKTGLKVKL
jgi:hypothetical protein